jgi:prostaglandin-H2 D-isomerase / glutathione transferase
MTRPKLTYFDAPVSRGEECRIALSVAGIEFEDERIPMSAWPALKPDTPFGGLPLLDVPGRGVLAQSNAILTFIGRQHQLHPTDAFEAARHEALMQHCEDLRAAIAPTQRMRDEAEKKAAREAIASGYLQTWAGHLERQLGDGPFVSGATLHVADIKIYMLMRWILRGTLDYIPADSLAAFPKLMQLHDAVVDNPKVRAWLQRQ